MPAADQRQDRHDLGHAREAVEEAVLGPEHDARADDHGLREGGADAGLALRLGPAVEAGRGRIGPDRRHLHQPQRSGGLGRGRDLAREPGLHRLELAGTALEQDADQVHDIAAAGHHPGHRSGPGLPRLEHDLAHRPHGLEEHGPVGLRVRAP